MKAFFRYLNALPLAAAAVISLFLLTGCGLGESIDQLVSTDVSKPVVAPPQNLDDYSEIFSFTNA